MGVKPIQSVQRALVVLEAVAERQPIGVADLSRALGDDKSAVQRALVTLQAAGWIQPVGDEPTRWELTARPLVVASRAERHSGLRERARAALDGLRDDTGETALFAVLDGARVVIVDTAESPQLLRTAPHPGMVVPTDTGALGRAILAQFPPADLGRFPDLTVDDTLLAELADVRRRGWSRKSRDLAPGTMSVGVAVLAGGAPVGALGITAPTSRLPADRERRAGRLLATAAAALSSDMVNN